MSFLNQIDIDNCKLMRKDHLSLCCWELKDGSASSIGCSLGSTNRHSLKEWRAVRYMIIYYKSKKKKILAGQITGSRGDGTTIPL